MLNDSIQPHSKFDAAVVGGGLSGLLAAVLIAREGRSVVVYEQARQLGGRAMTTDDDGIQFNLGAHALYRSGDAFRLLSELQIAFHGAFPNPGTAVGYYRGREYTLPLTLRSLITTRLLSIREKWQLSRLLQSLPSLETKGLNGMSAAQWVAQKLGNGPLAHLISTLFRLTTYVADQNHLSAGAALEQLKLSLAGNVWYIDGGWQSIIEGLRHQAEKLGVQIRPRSHITTVEQGSDGITLALSNGAIDRADSVVMAVGPQAACSLLQLPADHSLVQWSARQQPVRAACLDVALSRLSRPACRFALGLDQPHYFSVHSAAATLAPRGVHVIHLMKYLPSSAVESAGGVEQELEGLLDRVQPGWRASLLKRRSLPLMTVAHSHPEPGATGLAGRPPVAVSGFKGIYVAGDWVGGRGQLADAAAASAEEAARQLLAELPQKQARAMQHV